jgi:hypothetical protein
VFFALQSNARFAKPRLYALKETIQKKFPEKYLLSEQLFTNFVVN